MTDLRIYNLIHKRLTKEISPAELEELRSFENTEQYDSLVRDIESIWVESKDYFPTNNFDVEAAKAKFKSRLANELPSEKPSAIASNQENSYNYKWAYGLIAVVAISLLSYFAYDIWQKNATNVEVIEAKEELEYAKLEDNTEVWLSQSTVLAVNDFDGVNKRNLKLDGEAFFQVSPDPNKPFHIDLGNGNQLEVLGTKFNVISNLGDGSSKVDVKEGSVRLYNESNSSLSVIVTAGESSTINSKKNQANKVLTSRIYSLLGPSLSFKNEPLPKVFKEIGEVYKVNFNYNESAYTDCLFTSPLIDNFDINQIVVLLSEYYPNLKIKKVSDKTYSVKGIACQ